MLDNEERQKVLYPIIKHFPFMKKACDKIYEKFVKRYNYLCDEIHKNKSKKIMEIGTFNGQNALRMINAAKKEHNTNVEYYGFDLFEEMNKEKYCNEISRKPISEEETRRLLNKTRCKIKLIKGDTNKTLKKSVKNLPKMDFIFIDGGHSTNTILNDWNHSKKLMHDKTIIIFDDYWNSKKRGCKKIVDNINTKEYNVKVIKIPDIKILGQEIKKTPMAKITKKTFIKNQLD